MESIDPRGVAKFDPRGMIGTIYVENHLSLPRTKYQSCGPCGFREDFFYFFSHSKSMETINPWGVAKFDPRGMNGTIYVEDH